MSSKGERRERARQQILKAAAGAIAKSGYHGMSMRALARATGRSLANFYNYFSGKEDVLFTLQSRTFETLIETSSKLVDGEPDPAAKLYLFIANHVGYFVRDTDVMRVLLHEAAALPAKQRRRVRRLKERYFHIARDIVGALGPQACAAGDDTAAWDEVALERATYNVFGMMNWVYGWYQPKRHGPPSRVISSIHRMALTGLVPGAEVDPIQTAMRRQLAAEGKRPSPLGRQRDTAGRAA